jgi:hypothetical protein
MILSTNKKAKEQNIPTEEKPVTGRGKLNLTIVTNERQNSQQRVEN